MVRSQFLSKYKTFSGVSFSLSSVRVMSSVSLLDSGQPQLNADEQILSQTLGKLFSGEETSGREGRLFVTTLRLVFAERSNVEFGLAWNFRTVALHAVAQPSEGFPRPSIYIQLGVAEEDDEMTAAQELRFVPDEENVLGEIFDKMSQGAALNPDPIEMMSDDDDEEANAAWQGKLVDNSDQFADQ